MDVLLCFFYSTQGAFHTEFRTVVLDPLTYWEPSMDEFDKSGLVTMLLAVESSPVGFPVDILKHLVIPCMFGLHMFPKNGSCSGVDDFPFMPGGDGSLWAVDVKASTLDERCKWDWIRIVKQICCRHVICINVELSRQGEFVIVLVFILMAFDMVKGYLKVVGLSQVFPCGGT